MQAATPEQRVEERRGEPRRAMTRPCKVYHRASGRYVVGWTCDVSATGVLLRTSSPRRIAPGDEVEVLVAWRHGELLHASDQAPGRVVRALAGEGGQVIAVEVARGALGEPGAQAAAA